MHRIPILAVLLFAGSTVWAQHASRVGELRLLLHPQEGPPKQSIQPAQDTRKQAELAPAPQPHRQLTPQERAELRRQLSEFRRPSGKGS